MFYKQWLQADFVQRKCLIFFTVVMLAEPAKFLVPLEYFELLTGVSRGTEITSQYPCTGVLTEQLHEFLRKPGFIHFA